MRLVHFSPMTRSARKLESEPANTQNGRFKFLKLPLGSKSCSSGSRPVRHDDAHSFSACFGSAYVPVVPSQTRWMKPEGSPAARPHLDHGSASRCGGEVVP